MHIETVAETGSTNDDLLARATQGAAEGLWLRAERQSGGKGRQGRVWQSPPGNLYASTLVRLQPSDPPAPGLALVAAVALHQAASCFAPRSHNGEPLLRIKWPNDLIAGDGAKVAGILLERAGDAVVTGFGVNLAHHPEGLGRPATSLQALFGRPLEPEMFLISLAEIFAEWAGRWRRHGLDPVRRAWLRAAHPVGTPLSTPEGEGVYQGLDDSGALLLKLPSGEVRLVRAGDVFLI